MKKVLILIGMLFLLCGCSKVDNLSYEEIIEVLDTNPSRANVYRTGYKYYLPRTLKIEESKLFNEVISSDRAIFYLYVDAISFYNKVSNTYKTNKTSIYSKNIINEDKYGYLEINLLENKKYLIEIMYNYAKIEVIVEEDDIKESLLYAIEILKNISYNENIIAKLLSNDVLNYAEEEFNIFNTTSSDSNYIQIDDSYQETEEKLPDTDLIN